MFLLIVICAIVIVGIVISIREQEDIFLLFTVIVAVAATLVLGLILSVVGTFFENDELYKTEETPIVALADTPGSEGHMFLGAGDIESSMCYFYMTENDDGSKNIAKIKSDHVSLYEDEDENPRIVKCYYRNENPIVRFFFFTEESRTELHIPPNSIKYRFNVDLN